MRPTTILAAAVLALGLSLPAAAGGDDLHPAYGNVQVDHRVYAPNRYKHIYHMHRRAPRPVHVVHGGGGDPHAWYYAQRGYYPYYYSGYWVPRADMRYRHRYAYFGPKYRYYPAWGYGYVAPRHDHRHWHRHR